MEIIGWIGFAQGLFAAIIMFTKSDQTVSDRVLSAWLTLLAFEFLTCAMDFRLFNFSLLSSSFLLFNPALFIYIRSLVQRNFELKWTMLLHLVPFLVSEVLAYITRIPLAFEDFFQMDSALHIRLLFSIPTLVSWAVYFPLSIRLLHRYRVNLQNEKSNIDKEQNLNWLLFVSLFYIIYCLIAIVLGFVFVFTGVGTQAISYYNYSLLLILIYIISFYGLYQKRIEIQTDTPGEKETTVYKNSILSSEIKQIIKDKILTYFAEERPYLNPNLNMDLLSEAISFPKYQNTKLPKY